MKISEKDRKFVPVNPEPNFNERRNKHLVNEIIRDYEAKRASVQRMFRRSVQERAEAVASYLTSERGARSRNPVERYFGKRTLAQLRGEDIIGKIRKITQYGPKT
jgi:hypothetical protein